jgi:hypothetical protein
MEAQEAMPCLVHVKHCSSSCSINLNKANVGFTFNWGKE